MIEITLFAAIGCICALYSAQPGAVWYEFHTLRTDVSSYHVVLDETREYVNRQNTGDSAYVNLHIALLAALIIYIVAHIVSLSFAVGSLMFKTAARGLWFASLLVSLVGSLTAVFGVVYYPAKHSSCLIECADSADLAWCKSFSGTDDAGNVGRISVAYASLLFAACMSAITTVSTLFNKPTAYEKLK